jgi:hypothetical protein
MTKRLSQIGFIVLVLGSGAFAEPGADQLAAARQHFAQGHLKEMAVALRLALLNGGDSIQGSGIQLLEEAYEKAGTDGIPADITFPPEITSLRVDFNRIQRINDFVSRAQVHVGVKEGVKLDRVQLFRAAPFLRLADNGVPALGTLTKEANDPTKYTISADLPEGTNYSMPGLYQLRVTPKGGHRFVTSFLTGQGMASTSPEFSTPLCQIFEEATPTLNFFPFVSTEHKKFETRSLELIANYFPSAAGPFENIVTQKLSDADATQVTFGKGELASKPLAKDGVYHVVINYLEGRKFGPIVVNRSSQRTTSIRVLRHGQSQECF